jgi:hypothetical protein
MRRALIVGLSVLVALALTAVVLYEFGAPQAPAVPKADPNAKAPAADPRTPLAIRIPGCVCHSKDPKIVQRHAAYHMNQCAGCHSGKAPTGPG